jgi:myo-inositol-1(or 4)-monophosphatase
VPLPPSAVKASQSTPRVLVSTGLGASLGAVALDLDRDIERIRAALALAVPELRGFAARLHELEVGSKGAAGPVSEADRRLDELLRTTLPQPGDGWLSEETADDAASRLSCSRVWIVDPLDGTKEFLQGIPEWSVSIGLVIDGEPVAGGIANPATGVEVFGAVGVGVWRNGKPAPRLPDAKTAAECKIVASRSEVGRGLWEETRQKGLNVLGVGSVAWKFAMVAAGDAHATWTHVPKHTWDVAGGFALVRAAGGEVAAPDGSPIRFDAHATRLPGAVGLGPAAAVLREYAYL